VRLVGDMLDADRHNSDGCGLDQAHTVVFLAVLFGFTTEGMGDLEDMPKIF